MEFNNVSSVSSEFGKHLKCLKNDSSDNTVICNYLLECEFSHNHIIEWKWVKKKKDKIRRDF